MDQNSQLFWSFSSADLLKRFQVTTSGLSTEEAKKRFITYGANHLKPPQRSDVFTLLVAQFKSPIILILLFATVLSFFLHDPADALIILSIVLISGLLGFWQEDSATNAVEKLLAMVQIKATVLRDNKNVEMPTEEIVPGDIAILSAGDIVPGDCLLLESKDLYVDEAMLTGETFPVEKSVSVLDGDTVLSQRTNTVWMGTHIVSGNAKALVTLTGKNTEFGKVSERLKLKLKRQNLSMASENLDIFLERLH